MRRMRILSLLVPGAAVLAVHGTNVSYPLFYDDYSWLAVTDRAGWLADVMTPGNGAFIYRPGLAVWFGSMQAVFGVSPVPYHLFALAFLVAAALTVRWLGLELGLRNIAATASGALYGAFAPLTLTTMWASAAGSSLAVALAVASVALICRPSARRHLAAAVLLAAAILARDATVVTPVLASLVLFVRYRDQLGFRDVIRRTGGLWLVAGAYLTMRAALLAQGANSGPYTVDFLGAHLATNLVDLMQQASRLSLPRRIANKIEILPVWDAVAWLSILGAAAWAFRRRHYLPLAGIAWFFVALSPVLVLPNHPMDGYYLDLAAVGLAITVGSLGSMIRLTPAIAAVALGAFVLVQAVAVQVIQGYGFFGTIVERTVVLQRIAATERPRGDELVVATHCPLDQEWSRDGDLFRVLQNDPELRVRFELVEPETCR